VAKLRHPDYNDNKTNELRTPDPPIVVEETVQERVTASKTAGDKPEVDILKVLNSEMYAHLFN
jgi:hypothetical protein